MFDHIANQLLRGTPQTTDLYQRNRTRPTHEHAAGNTRAIKIRNTLTGEVTHHPSVNHALLAYRGTYPKLLTGLIEEPYREWCNLQVKDEDDDTPWMTPSVSDKPKSKNGNKFVIFCLTHKETNEMELLTREGAAKKLGVSLVTIGTLAIGLSSGRTNYAWRVRHATENDLKLCPSFKYDPRTMVLREK